jgi:hypothetical protein
MSKVRGQPHFRVKRFWSAMRPHIAFEHTARGLARRLTRTCSHRPMAGLVGLGSLDGPQGRGYGILLDSKSVSAAIDSAATNSRSQWFIFAAAFMISACTTGMMSAM